MMGKRTIRDRVRAWLAGQYIYAAVWLLCKAGRLTPIGPFREDIRRGLRGLWDAGLHARDIDGGGADRIPARPQQRWPR